MTSRQRDAAAAAYALMKPQAEPADVRERCRRRTLRLVHSGRLVRSPCEGCGAAAVVEAHHENYRRPEHVRWLCRRCHDALHHRGAVLPVKLPPDPTSDEILRGIIVTGLLIVAVTPDPVVPLVLYRYYTLDEAAAYKGLTVTCLNRLIKAGTLPAIRDGRQWKIRGRDLEAVRSSTAKPAVTPGTCP